MGNQPRWKECEKIVSLWWVTYPDGKNMECGLIVMGDLPKKKERVVSFFGWPTQGEEWPHSYGWPTQVNKRWRMVSFFGWPTQVNKRWRMVSFFGWPTQKKWWSHCDGWPTQVEKWKNGLIMMGDLPGWKECEMRSHCNGWPTQMENMWSVVSL